ncbi:tetratricopeptide repeat protein [Dongia soli]|uniref:Tetratricopeptide repeat protein n=1 Tax=Dongia soli TaxID=600628 RepID=A0ABU5EC94_9PROT|nr:tetratricopeptide repeat protein [Dongia soli]MDY0883981.1 tetratricopeptide repeat protein [Dongia soli]
MKMPFQQVILSLALVAALPVTAAFAMGSDSTPSNSQADRYKQAKELVDDKEYAEAIPLLRKTIEEKGPSADALNLLGYSYRKSGNQQKGLDYYLQALKLEPNHLGANEYLGELYLEMNDLPKAQERLRVLKSACGDCEEYEDLEEAVADYKKAHGQS